jgi:hypothetical protein
MAPFPGESLRGKSLHVLVTKQPLATVGPQMRQLARIS